MKTETRSYYERVVQRALERIASHLDDALELDALAASSGLSPFHFHRIFRGMVGETAVELSRRLRMERAAWRLVHGDQGVTAIAFDAGYETHEGFTRAFRAAYVTSPSGFRQRRYPRIQLAASCGIHFDAAGAVPAFTPRAHEGEATPASSFRAARRCRRSSPNRGCPPGAMHARRTSGLMSSSATNGLASSVNGSRRAAMSSAPV